MPTILDDREFLNKYKKYINYDCYIEDYPRKLIIHIDKSKRVGSIFSNLIASILFFSGFLVFLYGTIQIVDSLSEQDIMIRVSLVIFLLFIQILFLFFTILPWFFYIRDKNRKLLWSMDKTQKTIKYKRISPKKKTLKVISFSEVRNLVYNSTGYIYTYFYVKLRLENDKKIKIYSTNRDDKPVLQLRNKISEFLNIGISFR